MKVNEKINQSKGNIEIEGIDVPKLETVQMLVKKYQDKLGKDAVDSLFYAICKGQEIYEEENDKRK